MKKVKVLRILREKRDSYDVEYEQATTLEKQNIARGKCAAVDEIYRTLEAE